MQILSYSSFLKQSVNSIMICFFGLGRCELELQLDREQFLTQNISEQDARPSWINSLTTLINYQAMMSNIPDPNLAAFRDPTLEQEEKLVRYMGLAGKSPDLQNGTRKALILHYFDLDSDLDAYWREIYALVDYIAIFAVLLYIVMVAMFSHNRK